MHAGICLGLWDKEVEMGWFLHPLGKNLLVFSWMGTAARESCISLIESIRLEKTLKIIKSSHCPPLTPVTKGLIYTVWEHFQGW